MINLSILIIDDDPAFRMLLKKRLASYFKGSDITEFVNLNEAREAFSQKDKKNYDIIFIDEHLPDGRGADLMREGIFEDQAVISMSSDDAPEIPGSSMGAGASFFLSKSKLGADLFKPLVTGLVERNRLSRELQETKLKKLRLETVQTLVGTLKHEINNPLGAVLGAVYLLKQQTKSPEQIEAAELVEKSAHRITKVLDELCQAVELDASIKGTQKVFNIPGDNKWEGN